MPVALTLAALLIVCLFVTAGAAAALLAFALLRPPRMSDGKAIWVLKRLSPRDFGWNFESVHFDIHDENGKPLRLAAWWIPADQTSDRCVVMVHGYADAKVGVIGWARPWRDLGWNILAIDLRAHGESGGRFSTGGYFERDDLDAVLNQLRAERPSQTCELALFGVSLGAAVATACAARRDDLAAVVLESPFAGFRQASKAHFERIGAPGGWVQTAALRLAEGLSGAKFEAVRPIDLLPQVKVPLLVISGEFDDFLPAVERERFRIIVEAHCKLVSPSAGTRDEGSEGVDVELRPPPQPSPGVPGEGVYANGLCTVWIVRGAGHLEPLFMDPEGYAARLRTFLDRITGRATSGAVFQKQPL